MNNYKSAFKEHVQELQKTRPSGSLDLLATPSYLHTNPLISHIFWKRIFWAASKINKISPRTALDFGCGTGITLPLFPRSMSRLFALDLDPKSIEISKEVVGKFGSPPLTYFTSFNDLTRIPKTSLDLIVALDVLEHISDLEEVLECFKNLLTAEGRLIVSLPTENVLYRIGRKLAGPEFTGHYHERGAKDIITIINRHLKKIHVTTLYPFLPLFKLAIFENPRP